MQLKLNNNFLRLLYLPDIDLGTNSGFGFVEYEVRHRLLELGGFCALSPISDPFLIL